MIPAGKLNKRVTINVWTSERNARGGSSGEITQTWTVWAEVTNVSGRPIFVGGTEYFYNYRIRMRYDPNRVIDTRYTIAYAGNEYRILEVVKEQHEGEWFIKLRCELITPQ